MPTMPGFRAGVLDGDVPHGRAASCLWVAGWFALITAM
jgi:hypothetical protein